jgi:hypothetical protein
MKPHVMWGTAFRDSELQWGLVTVAASNFMTARSWTKCYAMHFDMVI